MLDHIKTAETLERDARIVVNLGSSIKGIQVAKEISSDLLGLADYHRSKAETPEMHMKAESLMQRMAQELQETLEAMDEAGNDPMAGATIQALLDEHDAYWLETLNPSSEDTQECTPANLEKAASKVLISA